MEMKYLKMIWPNKKIKIKWISKIRKLLFVAYIIKIIKLDSSDGSFKKETNHIL